MVKDWGTNVNWYEAKSYDESQVIVVARNFFEERVRTGYQRVLHGR